MPETNTHLLHQINTCAMSHTDSNSRPLTSLGAAGMTRLNADMHTIAML
jgi:hypothetical protein